MNTKQLINQEQLQELKAQNNKLKSLVLEYFEETPLKTSFNNPYLIKQELKKEIIKLCNEK